MTSELQQQLEAAIRSDVPLADIVSLLRQSQAQGATSEEVYAFLETLRQQLSDEATEDRLLEVADFVAGFCAPHMKIWDN
jgi:hypothetical protein